MNFNTSKKTPPMPVNLGGWALIKKSPNLYSFYNVVLDQGSNIVFDQTKVNTISLECDE